MSLKRALADIRCDLRGISDVLMQTLITRGDGLASRRKGVELASHHDEFAVERGASANGACPKAVPVVARQVVA